MFGWVLSLLGLSGITTALAESIESNSNIYHTDKNCSKCGNNFMEVITNPDGHRGYFSFVVCARCKNASPTGFGRTVQISESEAVKNFNSNN